MKLNNPAARFALRAVLVGVAAAIASLQAGGSWQDILIAGLSSTLAYAGIGAAVPAVEPNVGRKA